MEKLTDFLQKLLSSCGEELRLEPDRNPYIISDDRNSDVANSPLLGTQIASIVFPLIPLNVRAQLPHKSEIDFVLPHDLGDFNFNVQKSPAGFIVAIRPIINNSPRPRAAAPAAVAPATPAPKPVAEAQPSFTSPIGRPAALDLSMPDIAEEYSPDESPAPAYELESSSFDLDIDRSAKPVVTERSDLLLEDLALSLEDYRPGSGSETEIEIISVNDPQFQTVFSDSAGYEPPSRRDDFDKVSEYQPPSLDTLGSTFGSSTPIASTIEPLMNNLPDLQAPAAPAFVPAPASYAPAAVETEAAFQPVASDSVMAARMDAMFNKMAEIGASDLHLSVSMPPMIRKDGKMKKINDSMSAIDADLMRQLLTSIMPGKNQQEFAERHDTDFAYEIPELARFRCNIFMDRKGMGAVFRIIPTKILTAEQLGLSKAIMDLTTLSKGLVVVTGPTGSGKSTTLCAMVDHINKNREDHIITIEDPIEFVHDNHSCLVNQREVHNHTDSFKDALRAALREDPDILLVGEMRDLETISIAIETAETGHLVFGTLHTTTAASTVDRIIDQFPADRQQQIRVMLSESLKGVIAQTLLPKKGGGRVAALEVLIVTPAISNLIREGKTFQIPSAMQTGKNHGMVMLNDALFEHVKNGLVEPMDAYMKAVDKTGFETQLTRGGFKL
jgi:twitching motility protein PilT